MGFASMCCWGGVTDATYGVHVMTEAVFKTICEPLQCMSSCVNAHAFVQLIYLYLSTSNPQFLFFSWGWGLLFILQRLDYTVMHTKAIVPGVCHGLKQCVCTIMVHLANPSCVGLPPNNLPQTWDPWLTAATQQCQDSELSV